MRDMWLATIKTVKTDMNTGILQYFDVCNNKAYPILSLQEAPVNIASFNENRN